MKCLLSTVYRLSELRKSVVRSRKAFSYGLTLLEVLVAVGIAAVAGTLLIVIIVNSAGVFSNQLPKVQEGLNINDSLSVVRSTIKHANAVSGQYLDGSTVYTSGTSQLVLQASSIDASNNIIDNTLDYFVFFLDQNFLRYKTFPNPLSSRKPGNRILSDNVENLVFKYFASIPPGEVAPQDANKVRITVTLKPRAGSALGANIATTEANLRND